METKEFWAQNINVPGLFFDTRYFCLARLFGCIFPKVNLQKYGLLYNPFEKKKISLLEEAVNTFVLTVSLIF
jgi:hypothetical protein